MRREDPHKTQQAVPRDVSTRRRLRRPDLSHGEPYSLGQALGSLQRALGNRGVVQLLEEDAPSVRQVLAGGGARLDDGVRRIMESRFGHDFGAVRIHSGPQPAASARSLGARAYTVGSDIVLGAGESVHGASGGRLLAHELIHVIQQYAGRVAGTAGPGGLLVSDPSDRFEREAEAAAQRFAAGTDPLPGRSERTPARSLPRSGQRLEETAGLMSQQRVIGNRAVGALMIQRVVPIGGPPIGPINVDDASNMPRWTQDDVTYHLNVTGGGTHHITQEGRSPGKKKGPTKTHYFFEVEGTDKIKPTRPTREEAGGVSGSKEMFNKLPVNVQNFVQDNWPALLALCRGR